MKFYPECAACLMDLRARKTQQFDEERRNLFLKKVCGIIAQADPQEDAPPLVDSRIIKEQRRIFGEADDFSAEKKHYNDAMLEIYGSLKKKTEEASDPVLAAMQYALAGNYIDFGVLKDTVSEDTLLGLLDEAAQKEVSRDEYRRFLEDMGNTREMVYLHDNCGEIVLDKLFLETLRARYPKVHFLSVVRGGPILNDATLEDAGAIGLDQVAEVVDNGVEDTAGTVLRLIRPELKRRMESAGVILSKGQGNFETLGGCGLNIYYLFLSKCEWYTRWYGFERFSAVLINEKRRNEV